MRPFHLKKPVCVWNARLSFMLLDSSRLQKINVIILIWPLFLPPHINSRSKSSAFLLLLEALGGINHFLSLSIVGIVGLRDPARLSFSLCPWLLSISFQLPWCPLGYSSSDQPVYVCHQLITATKTTTSFMYCMSLK